MCAFSLCPRKLMDRGSWEVANQKRKYNLFLSNIYVFVTWKLRFQVASGEAGRDEYGFMTEKGVIE